MRMRDLKNALIGKDRRIEELEDALRFCALACSARCDDDDPRDLNGWLDNIQEKCEQALDKQS